MTTQTQITTAQTLGMIAHENNTMRAAAQSKELMKMIAGREIGKTPKNEATTAELMNAYYSGWDKAKRIMMKEKFGF